MARHNLRGLLVRPPSLGLMDIGFNGIRDGTSNTMLVSETVIGFNNDSRGLAWWGDGATYETYLAPNSSAPDRVDGGCSYHYQRKSPVPSSDQCPGEQNPRSPPGADTRKASTPSWPAARSGSSRTPSISTSGAP